MAFEIAFIVSLILPESVDILRIKQCYPDRLPPSANLGYFGIRENNARRTFREHLVRRLYAPDGHIHASWGRAVVPPAFSGGKDAAKLPEALVSVRSWVEGIIK
jgi:hypothetical protein